MVKINERLVASMWQVRGDEIVKRAKKQLGETAPLSPPKHGGRLDRREAGVKSPVVAQVVMEESRQRTLVCGFTCPVLPTMVIDAQRRGSWPVHCGEAMGVE